MEFEAELALHKAAENGDLQAVKNILDQGVAVDTRKDQFKKTSLMKAAEKGHKEVVELLLSRGADIEAQNMLRYTALLLAAENGHKPTVEALLACRPNIEAKNNYNRTALVVAAVCGYEEIVDVLVAHGADIEAKDKDERTALSEAASCGRVKVVDVLLTLGADIEAKNTFDGRTALVRATHHGKEETVDLLLNRGANIEASDKDGNTALMVCVRSSRLIGIMAKLIAHGANVSAKNKVGKTAVDIAKRDWIGLSQPNREIVQMLENALANPTVPQTNPKPKLVPVLPSKWKTKVDEKTNETIYLNTETNEQLQVPPPTFPLLQDPAYGKDIAFYDEATEEDITSDGSTIDFGNGVEVTVPEGVVPPNTSITFKAQPAFASKDVFVLPSAVEAASPTYLLSSSSENLNGNVTLAIEHFMDLQTEEDAGSLVFLVADSEPTQDSTYHFREVDTGHPVFKPGERVGTISTNHFSFWKIGWKSVKKMFLGAPSRYTVRVYRSPENSSSSVAIVCVSYLHSVYAKFLDYLDKNLVPTQYPEVSTKVIDQIIKEPLCFAGDELKIQASSTPGWSFDFDTTSIPKESADLPEELQVKPEELHSYPPKIVCRFTPTAKAPQKTTCTLTLLGLDRPVTVSIPLFSPKRVVDCVRLKDALFSLRVTIEGMHRTKLAPAAKEISSEMDDIISILSTSSSGEDLARHTQTIFDKVLGFVTNAKEVSKEATAHHISAQLQTKLPEVEKTSHNFNQIAKEQLLHCTGITEVEKVLSDFVVTGSRLVSLIQEVVTDSERLTSIAGLDIDRVDNTTLSEDDDSADILRELDGLESEYYTLGLHLHLPPGKVREIQENNPHNANAALGQIITQWLMMNYEHNKFGKPSWRMLVEGVSTVDLERAKIIADKHKMMTSGTEVNPNVGHTPVQSENPPGKADSPGKEPCDSPPVVDPNPRKKEIEEPDDGHQKQPQVKPIIEPVTRRRSETQQPPKTNRYRHIGIAVAIVILGVGLGYFLRSRFRTRL